MGMPNKVFLMRVSLPTLQMSSHFHKKSLPRNLSSNPSQTDTDLNGAPKGNPKQVEGSVPTMIFRSLTKNKSIISKQQTRQLFPITISPLHLYPQNKTTFPLISILVLESYFKPHIFKSKRFVPLLQTKLLNNLREMLHC